MILQTKDSSHYNVRMLCFAICCFSLIWQIAIPKSWLVLKIVCLYKKGLKSLAENYLALSIGSNLSKLVPRIILNRLQETYEHNISEAQFGFLFYM